MTAHEQEVGRAVLPAGQGHGSFEAGQVHPIRDDLVVARKEAVDEMPGGGADRDPAVQPAGVALQEAPAELVRGREPGVGVERGDVHAARLVEQDQRQEGHERFVEVEHVELLPFEHPADLADVAGRDRDRAHRPVGGHAEALAQADHVAFRGALQAVAAADDPDVMAALAEVLVEVPDVLVDPTRIGVDVGRDQADLHGRSPSRPGSKRGGRSRPPG